MGNLNNNFQKNHMPGGLPGGGGVMLKLRFDRYITWMGLTVGGHFNFYITGLLIQFTKFILTCKIFIETISSRCSSDIHRNDVTFIFLSLQNRLTLRALSPRDSVGENINITSQIFR